MRRVAAILTAVAMLSPCVSGKKIRTTRPRLVASQTVAADTAVSEERRHTSVCDTAVALYGFDKPLQSSHESVLAKNRLGLTVRAVCMTIEYLDRKGRQLHKRSCRVETEIPPGETRLLRFASWDRQNSFYYEKSRRPQRAEATRFSVICTVDSVETD